MIGSRKIINPRAAGTVINATIRTEKVRVFFKASKSLAAAWCDIIGRMAVATAMAYPPSTNSMTRSATYNAAKLPSGIRLAVEK